MTAGATPRDELALVAGSFDPLGIGLTLAADRADVLLEAARRFGDRPALRHAKDLLDAGARLAAADPALVIPHGGNPAICWLRAGVARARGDHEAAAAASAAAAHGEGAELRAFRELFCAKELARAGDASLRARAWRHLRSSALAAPDLTTLLAIDALRARLTAAAPAPLRRKLRVAVLGGVTLDLVAPAIRAAAAGRDIEVDLWVGGFDQYRQEILGPAAGLDAFAPEVVVLIVDVRSLGLPEEVPDPDAVVTGEVGRLRSLWRAAVGRWACHVLQTTFAPPAVDPYGPLSASLPGGRRRVIRRLDLALQEAAASEPGTHLVDCERIATACGSASWDDPAAWHSAKQAPGPASVPALAHEIASLLQAIAGTSAKCLVVDLDDTIWGGAVGDVGVDGIVLGGTPLGEAFVEFQRYLHGLAARGVAVAVCSKNDEAAARAPFREHPEMILREDDLAHFVASWGPKAESIRGIAEDLGLGLDSIVVVDDNPLERELVRMALPEVTVLDVPDDPAHFAAAVDASGLFASVALTSEDRGRTASYRAEIARTASMADPARTVDELISSLDMTADIVPFREVDVPRLHQLTNKTNQFNLTTVRMSAAEVRALVDRPDVVTQSVRLRDRFGDYGLVAVLIGRPQGDDLCIDQWLMSCRVFGRRLEDVMIARAAEAGLARGLTHVRGEYHPTARNGEFASLYERLGFTLVEEREDGARTFRADAASIAGRPMPGIAVAEPAGAAVRA